MVAPARAAHDTGMKTTDQTLAQRLRAVRIQKAYNESRIADGQRLQREAGIAKGGTVESGGACR